MERRVIAALKRRQSAKPQKITLRWPPPLSKMIKDRKCRADDPSLGRKKKKDDKSRR